mgnify:CR=1 FL=1
MTMTKEQIDALPGLVARFDCHGWDIRRGIMRQADDGAWVEYDDYATLAATVIEQQAEIDRLRGIVRELIEMLDYDKSSERYRIAVDAAYEEIDQ